MTIPSASTYGGVQVPLGAPPAFQAGQVLTDPAIEVTLAFLKAFLQADGGATAAWDANGVARGQPVVAEAFAFDPRKHDGIFTDNQLPALFCWREQASVDWEGEDYETESADLHLLWMFPIATQQTMSVRSNFANGMAKAIKHAIAEGRTPSFVVAGDPDAKNAGKYGSAFGAFTGAVRLWPKSHRVVPIQVEMTGPPNQRPPQPKRYSGLEMIFGLREWKLRDPTAPRYQLWVGSDLTLIVNGGPSQVEGRAP